MIRSQGIIVGAARLGISEMEYAKHVDNGESWCSFHQGWEPQADFYQYPTHRSSCCREGAKAFVYQRRARLKTTAARRAEGAEEGHDAAGRQHQDAPGVDEP